MNLTPERWQHIARIYELAVDKDADTREAFVAEACAGDHDLRCEVESLLRQDEGPIVLDRSVWATAAPLFDESPVLGRGDTLGPYRIEDPAGAGGMGEVFRAIDTRLNRAVAIKVLSAGVALDPKLRARFAREAQTVAALTHPNICTLYDVGRQDQIEFLVMEYLEGETLAARLAKAPLSPDQAVRHAMEIATALDHAHRHGIVHRDLKPANIMLTEGGAKLLDFGLAKFLPAAGAIARDQDATGDGSIEGTVRYMAPEQIEGQEADARSDLFSFGAVFFEMLTGRRAFEGDTPARVAAAILEREPPAASSLQPLSHPALDEIVRRCLEKDRHKRWQTAGDVMRELERVSASSAGALAPGSSRSAGVGPVRGWVARILVAAVAGFAVWTLAPGSQRWLTPSSSRIRSVAVMPLENLSGDPEQEYFADGMTKELIAELARTASVGGPRLISSTSVMQYRNARRPLRGIARDLNVDAVIDGSVVRADGKVRITIQLIRTATAEIIWARSYQRDLRDVLTLQSEMARNIAREVGVTLTPQEQGRLATARPVDPETHRLVLLGRHHAAKATEEGLHRAVEYFDAALAKDPANAPGHAGLADAYMGLSGFYAHPREVMPKAKRAAETAILLDESLADAHAALGFIHLVYDWDGPAAEKALLRALDLNPTLATARLHYAAYLTTQARDREAEGEIRRAVEFDPLSTRTHAMGTSLLLFTENYDEAIELARRGLEFDPNSAFALAFQGVAYAQQGRFSEAVSNLERAEQLDKSPTILALEAMVLAIAGRKDAAARLIRQVEDSTKQRYFCPYEIGAAYVSLGDPETAHKWFRKGVEDRADCMAWLGTEPWIDPFRQDPRYVELLRDIGLDPGVR